MEAPGDPAHGLVDQWMSSQVPYRRGASGVARLSSVQGSSGQLMKEGTMQFGMNSVQYCAASISTSTVPPFLRTVVQDLVEYSTVTVGHSTEYSVLDCTHTVRYSNSTVQRGTRPGTLCRRPLFHGPSCVLS